MKDLATHALNQLLRLSAYTLAKLVVKRSSTLSLVLCWSARCWRLPRARRAPRTGRRRGWTRGTRGFRRSARGRGSRTGAGWRAAVAACSRARSSPTASSSRQISTATSARCAPTTDSSSGKSALRSTVQGTPAIARGRVFVPTVGNKVVALRLLDGAQVWTRDVGGMTLSSPTAVNADLVVSAGFPREDGAAAVGRDGRGRLAEPAGDGAVQQHVAGGGRGAGGRRRERRPLLRVRRRDGRAALGVRRRRPRPPGGAADRRRPRLHGGRRQQPPRARGRGGDGHRGRGLAHHAAGVGARHRRDQQDPPACGVVDRVGRGVARVADAARRRDGHQRRRRRRPPPVARDRGRHRPDQRRHRLAAVARAWRGGRPERCAEVLRMSDARGLRERRRSGAGRRRLVARGRGRRARRGVGQRSRAGPRSPVRRWRRRCSPTAA